jgi:hypothetical protein
MEPSSPVLPHFIIVRSRAVERMAELPRNCNVDLGYCRDSMKMSPCELFRNVSFGTVRAARSAPANADEAP